MSGPSFRYAGHELDASDGVLRCRYALGDRSFAEVLELGEGDWDTPAAIEAARLVYLLAAVSYYKTAAPRRVELDVALRPAELDALVEHYVRGLGEFAHHNGIDLGRVEFAAETRDAPGADYVPRTAAPLVPFGGGIDSIVTVESLKGRHPGATLFVVEPHTEPFAAIEGVVPITGLPVARVRRSIDPQLFEDPAISGFLQGHVPVTGIITALATLVAIGRGLDAVVMSNEWSASVGNLVVGGRVVNHQYSKSQDFEERFARVVRDALGDRIRVFSFLRPYSELWVAERFARMGEYHRAFRSCNRAFPIDPARRLEHWCGECDKCCFIDLVLAPFMARVELEAVFAGREPLARPELADRFERLVGLSPDPKPFECVGEVGECRAAAALGAVRGDRNETALLQALAARLPAVSPAEVAMLLAPHRPNDVPDDYATEDQLV